MKNMRYQSIAESSDLISTGKISPVELIESSFAEVDQGEPRLNAFITLFREESLESARQAEKEIRDGQVRGPLHGIPIALKDLIDVAGTRTTCGSKFFATAPPSESDATVAVMLKRAGAIIIGKTNLHEFAFGVTTDNPHFGATANPWDTSRVPGGSSGGSSAAVVAGFCAGALGTDTGGSVRIPSALCGNVGLKPTYGRVSVHGITELAQSLDCVGPMCRYVGDVAIMMNVLAGYDHNDVHCEDQSVPDYAGGLERSIVGIKAGIPKQHFFRDLHPGVKQAVREAISTLEGLGVEIVDIDLPSVPDAHEAVLTILKTEANFFHQNRLADRREDFGVDVREILESAQQLSTADYISAVRLRETARREFLQAFGEIDLILAPTVPVPAPLRSETDPSTGSNANQIRPRLTQNTRIFNLLGLPAISVPCGFTEERLPVGLQISGRWWSEKTLLQVGHAYEQATSWHTMWPDRPEEGRS